VVTLAATAGSSAGALVGVMRRVARAVASPTDGAVVRAVAGSAALDVALGALVAPLAAAVATAALAGALQTRGLFAWRAVGPDFGRLSLAKGLGRVFGAAGAIEVVKGLVKVALVATVAVALVAPIAPELPWLTGMGGRGVLVAFGVLSRRTAFGLALALLVLGALDWLLVARRHRRDLMMTREEIKREHKETEGDPHHRAERQRLHRELAEQRMLDDVRKASFVVVNPEHLAVAVRYDTDASGAPIVVAKGERHFAQRIREVAREAGVPVYRDVTLARALGQVAEGDEIPEDLYEAVAEVLRVLWQLEQNHRPMGFGSEGPPAPALPSALAPRADAGVASGAASPASPSSSSVPAEFWKRA
jgi:flagellar biosynthesis protein FlhB